MLDKNIFGEVPEVVHNTVVNTLDSLEETTEKSLKSGSGWWNIPRAAVVVVLAFLVTGITVSSVNAVRENYKQRMEEMTHEDYEEFYSMVENDVNRLLTSEEKERYYELEEIYERNGVFPEGQIAVLEKGAVYSGRGIALDMESGMLYFPEEELSDEELLQLIDYRHKYWYSVYMLNEEREAAEINWRSRAMQMTEEEVEELYVMWCYANGHVFRQRMEELTAEDYETFANMQEKNYNRQLTEEELARYEALEEDYKRNGRFPDAQIAVLEKGDIYSGAGVAISVEDATIYFPEQALSDEEMLQWIDFRNKRAYSIYMLQIEMDRAENVWIDRVENMTYDEMLDLYLNWWFADTEIRGGFTRELTAEEQLRYDELCRKYEEEGLCPEKTVYIAHQEDLIGEGVTFYTRDCTFYLPHSELTDEELLQIIDFIYRAKYVCNKIDYEVEFGLREEYYIYR